MAWYKDHRVDADLLVTASAYRGDDGRIRATVFAHGEQPDRVKQDTICDSYDITQARAEEDLLIAYPHACGRGVVLGGKAPGAAPTRPTTSVC